MFRTHPSFPLHEKRALRHALLPHDKEIFSMKDYGGSPMEQENSLPILYHCEPPAGTHFTYSPYDLQVSASRLTVRSCLACSLSYTMYGTSFSIYAPYFTGVRNSWISLCAFAICPFTSLFADSSPSTVNRLRITRLFAFTR